MSSQYYPRFSLRDLFRMGGSSKRHRLGRTHKKHKERQYQQSQSTSRRSKHVHFEDDPHHKSQPSSRRSRHVHFEDEPYEHRKPHSSSRRSRHVRSEEDPYTFTHHPNKPYLSTLPPEIQLSIFETLDPISSTCLGLTSRQLYPMHKARHKKVGLYEGSYEHGRPLAVLLKDWTPEDLVLDWESERLVSQERHHALQAAREREGRRFRESSVPVHTPRRSHSRRYALYEGYYDDPRPRLRRQRHFERHDLWYR